MGDAQPDEGFRVTDRRGRPDGEDPTPAPERVARPDAGSGTEAGAPPPSGRSGAARPAPADAERSLAGLFMMLASSAMVALGMAPDPMTGQAHIELEQAAELIDLLLLLRERTEGHRTAEEGEILERIIYDLQLRYVAATKRSG